MSSSAWGRTPDQREVWQVIETINLAWVNARWGTLQKLFDEQCVLASPGLGHRMRGRDAVIDSYKDFLDRSAVHEFKEIDPAVDVNDDVAVATYRFEITWDTEGKKYVGSGHDLFVLRRANGSWRAVWRTLIPGEEREL